MKDQAQPRLTTVRKEVKYLLEPREAQRTLDLLKKHLPLKEVDGRATSYRVTVYLDTADLFFCRRELQSKEKSVKLRIKDYYQYDGYQPVCSDKYWLEAKVRVGTMVEKSRFIVKKKAIEKVLQYGVQDRMPSREREAADAFEAIRKGRVLTPVFITHYRRTTLQDEVLNIRMTFDDCVTYHAPLKGLFVLYDSISRRDLPPPLKVETQWVVEMKISGSVPPFVQDILDPGLQVGYSKFGTGVRELKRRGMLK